MNSTNMMRLLGRTSIKNYLKSYARDSDSWALITKPLGSRTNRVRKLVEFQDGEYIDVFLCRIGRLSFATRKIGRT